MKKIKIGIPRAFLYYRYGVLWKNFFESLGCNVILSPETNKEILDLGVNNTIDECCLSYKIYIGHALYLSKNVITFSYLEYVIMVKKIKYVQD